jgi:hypothetical protein
MNLPAKALLALLVFGMVACSADDQKPHERGDHVWGDQVRAYDRARAVEGQLQDATEREKKKIDEQTE